MMFANERPNEKERPKMSTQRQITSRLTNNKGPEPEDLPAEHDDLHSSRSEGGRRLRPWGGQQAFIIINFKNDLCEVLDRVYRLQCGFQK
jgi:hypothetical protein